MPYNNKPFNYFGQSPYQVRIDLEKANDNFNILADAFKESNPDTGIVKEALKLDGFIPSQTPQPSAIPVADMNGKISFDWLYASQLSTPNSIPIANSEGKLDVSWIPDEIIQRILSSSSCSSKVISSDTNSDNTATINADFNSSNEIIATFSNAKQLVLNIAMIDNSVIDVELVLDPVVNIPQYRNYTYLYLYPNNTIPAGGVFSGYNDGFYLNFLNIIARFHFKIRVIFSEDKRLVYVEGHRITGMYTFDDYATYSMLRLLSPSQFYDAYKVYDVSTQTSAWFPYTPTGQLIPWNTLGTLSWSPYIMNGYIYLKRGEI